MSLTVYAPASMGNVSVLSFELFKGAVMEVSS